MVREHLGQSSYSENHLVPPMIGWSRFLLHLTRSTPAQLCGSVFRCSPIQGSRGWLTFGECNKIPSSFRRAHICKFSRQKHCFFTVEEKQSICGCQGTYTCKDTSIFKQQSNLFFFTKARSSKALKKLSIAGFLQTLRNSPKAL